MPPTESIELAYGLLWVVGSGRSTKRGEALYQARKALLAQIDKAGQSRGIVAANKLLGREDIGGCMSSFEAEQTSLSYRADHPMDEGMKRTQEIMQRGDIDMGRPACGQGDEWGRKPTDKNYGERKL